MDKDSRLHLVSKEFIKRRNKLRCGELDRSIVINKGEDMKRISQHLGRIADFRYIADIPIFRISS